MTFRRLLAKSLPPSGQERPSVYLPQHLADAASCADALLSATLAQQLHALRLSEVDTERFARLLRMSAVLHDLGKANDHFQGMIWGTEERERLHQALRHEWVTVLMLLRPELADWLRGVPGLTDLDWQIVKWAIAGHHPAARRPSPPEDPTAQGGCGSRIVLLMGHPDFAACLKVIRDRLALNPEPPTADEAIDVDDACRRIRKHWNKQTPVDDDLSPADRAVVAAVKATLLGADVSASALPTLDTCVPQFGAWIDGCLQKVPTPRQLAELIDDRLGPSQSLRPFQLSVAQKASPASEVVALVQAGCGSGKTLAAYHWARMCCPHQRLYLCYPTTGTATEGFRDYLVSGESPRFDAELFHSRAEVDLEMLDVRPDADSEFDQALRVDSLAAWSTPIVCCTVDTVLGLFQNHRRALYSWPALTGAALVFDEIHSYDSHLFGALLRLLHHLPGIPVLLMTASLPSHRLDSLQQALERGGRRLETVAGPQELERLPRYRRAASADAVDPLSAVAKELKAGGKVLWVANTVNRAMEFAARALALKPLIYHSRFRYEDRVTQHAAVVEAFRYEGPALAICTQVAEMSLDLSATLLVTDLASIPALIQRLGRLNRRARTKEDGSRTVLVIEPLDSSGQLSPLPYEADELALARNWLAALPESFSQADLVAAWLQVAAPAPDQPENSDSAWWDGGPRTEVKELRESSPGITVLLESDLPAVQRQPKQLPRYVIPMPPPKSRAWKNWTRFRGIPVVPSDQITYDPQRGAKWPDAK